MRIVSLNAWCGASYDALARWLPGVGADVVCFQEVTCTPGIGGWTMFRDDERELSQRANLYVDVMGLLPQHQGSFDASDAGPVTTMDEDGRSITHRQNFGLATFIDGRYPVVGRLSEFVFGTFTDHEHWPGDGRPRIAQGVRLLDRDGQRYVTIVHLHGLRDTAGKGDTATRRHQAERLVALVERLRRPGDLTIVCGDFNVLPDSITFDLLGDIGLVDLVGRADTRTSSYTKPTRHANYLLVSDRTAVDNLDIPARPEVSDHRPLIVDIA